MVQLSSESKSAPISGSDSARTVASFGRYVLAVGLTAAAVPLTFYLQRLVSHPFLIVFHLAVMLAAWFGGNGPAVLAVVLSTLAFDYFFLDPPGLALGIENIPYLAAFAVSAVIVGWLASARRRAESSLRQARAELEVKVLERTAELRRANEALLADMAERRRAEESLRKAQAELAHVSRTTTLGELTASIAHEINQPLAAIVANGNASLRWLAADPPNLQEVKEATERVIRDGNRASEIIARVRRMLKKEEARREPVDVREVVAEVIAFAQPELTRHDVSVRTETQDSPARALADRVQIQQVLLNLIVNGIDAMSSVAQASRQLTIGSKIDNGGSVLVTVKDCGVGLTEEDARRIFDAFYTTKPGGLGMGLSVSRSIVEAHGGRLWATANPEGGSTFQFTLPAAESATA